MLTYRDLVNKVKCGELPSTEELYRFVARDSDGTLTEIIAEQDIVWTWQQGIIEPGKHIVGIRLRIEGNSRDVFKACVGYYLFAGSYNTLIRLFSDDTMAF